MRMPVPVDAQSGPWGGILLVYFSTHGRTASVAERLAQTLVKEGLEVDLSDAAHAGDVDPIRHDVVVVGASLHREPDRREIVEWIANHRPALTDRPTALFSVRLTGAGDGGVAEPLGTARGAIDELVAETGWTPARSAAIADRFALERFADEIAILAASPLAA
ncbi:MAG: flavodoxin domain-containing protein [Solirubrobacteraceae bacterium]